MIECLIARRAPSCGHAAISVGDHEIAQVPGCECSTVSHKIKRLLPPEEWRLVSRYATSPTVYYAPEGTSRSRCQTTSSWLFGLLLADRTTDGRWRVTFRLAITDRACAELASVVGSDAPITVGPRRKKQDVASCSITDKEVLQRLVSRGLDRAQSYAQHLPCPLTAQRIPTSDGASSTATAQSAGTRSGVRTAPSIARRCVSYSDRPRSWSK